VRNIMLHWAARLPCLHGRLSSNVRSCMRRSIALATKKLQRSAALLEYRRINWRVETNHRIRWELEAFVQASREVGLPFVFHLQQHDHPNEGLVQLTVASSFTGVVDRKTNLTPEGLRTDDTPVVETGGEFVASQSAAGMVHFVVHPRRSDRIKPKRSEVFIVGPLDPADVTRKIVQKAIARYLLILQSSSLIGSEDALRFLERWRVRWMYFRDPRRRYELYDSLLALRNEWGKALVAGLVALIATFIAGYVTGSKT
jgi:hypothetical protein